MLRQFGQQLPRAKGEDAAIPAVTAACQIGLRGRQIGLFDKPRHGQAAGQLRAVLKIAIACLGPVRGDTK